MERRPILGLTLPELEAVLSGLGEPPYRAKQIFHWLYRRGAGDFSEMTNLSASLRGKLGAGFRITSPASEVLTSGDGTKKFRFGLGNEETIEAVWMPEARRKTLCVSSQVGCPLACKFCVTGASGFKRNLRADEIVAQVRHAKVLAGLPVSNVVFMGMGEPLLNYEEVLRAIRIISSDHGFKIGRRKITVSTVGITPRIVGFLKDAGVSLAVSLTGTNERDRSRWVPISRKYPLEGLMETLRNHPWKKGKKVTFEVVLIHPQTDEENQARELAERLRGIPCMVNLIPYNENPDFPDLRCPPRERVLAYQNVLIRHGIRAMIRKNRGRDIMAACGQLAGRGWDE